MAATKCGAASNLRGGGGKTPGGAGTHANAGSEETLQHEAEHGGGDLEARVVVPGAGAGQRVLVIVAPAGTRAVACSSAV